MTNSGEGLTLRELVMEVRTELRAQRAALEELRIDYHERGERITALEGKVDALRGLLRIGWIALSSVIAGLFGLAWAVFQKILAL